MLAPWSERAWHPLSIFPAEAFHLHINVAGWTAPWMTENVTFLMSAVFMLLPLAIFSTRMREGHGRVVRLIELPAETQILWHFILCVAKVAVRAGPAVESQDFLSYFLCFCLLVLIWMISL